MNKKLIIWSIGLLVALGLQANALSIPVDSIGLEKKDGKVFILHRVDDGQTLYGIARRYNSSVEAIQSANPALGNAVKFNQIIRIPTIILSKKETKALEKVARSEASPTDKIDETALYKPTSKPKNAKQQAEADAKAAQKIEIDVQKKAGIHVVEGGQTLYSLAVRYDVLLADLRKWNNLSSDNLRAGQELIINEKAYQARTPANPPAVALDKPTPAKAEPAKPEPVKTETPKPVATKPESVKTEPAKPVASKPESAKPALGKPSPVEPTIASTDKSPTPGFPTKGRRISEIGMADVIDASDQSTKYLALHRTAPIGSLVQVRNDVNNASLWVKVIGKLPDTGVNDRILIKLSARAFEKLSPNQQRFRAEVTYMVP